MGSSRQQTHQKRAREQAVRERREQKQAKRHAAAAERKSEARETEDAGHVPGLKLAVGDEVVYGPHGVGRITARERRAGEGGSNDVVVLALQNGLTVTLQLAQALGALRAVADETDLRRIEETLRTERDLPAGPWLSRQKAIQAKLNAGDSVVLAEIVAEGAQRERLRVAPKKESLSPGERSFFVGARRLLAGEIAVARGLEQPAADDWIEEQLGRHGAG